MNDTDKSITSGTMIAVLAAGYGALVLTCILLERVGTGANIIKWLLTAGVFLPFLGLGLISTTLKPALYWNGAKDDGSFVTASFTAGALMTGGFIFVLSSLAYIDLIAPLVLGVGMAAGILLFGIRKKPDQMDFPGNTPSVVWTALHFQNVGVRYLVCFFMLLFACGLLASEISYLIIFLGTITGKDVSSNWILAACFLLTIVLFAGQSGLRRSLAFCFWVSAAGVLAPLAIIAGKAKDIEFSQLFSSYSDAGNIVPVNNAVSTLTYNINLASFSTLGFLDLAMVAVCLLVATFVFLSLIPNGRTSPRTAGVSRLVAIILLVIFTAAVSLGARLGDVMATTALNGLYVGDLAREAGWLFREPFSVLGYPVSLCGENTATSEIVTNACGGPTHQITVNDIQINAALAFLVPNAIHGMPYAVWPTILLAMMTAAAGTAAFVLFSVSSSTVALLGNRLLLSGHLALARIIMTLAAIGGSWLVHTYQLAWPTMALWAGTIACPALFLPLLLAHRSIMQSKWTALACIIFGALPGTLVVISKAATSLYAADNPALTWLTNTSLSDAMLSGVGASVAFTLLAAITVDKNETQLEKT